MEVEFRIAGFEDLRAIVNLCNEIFNESTQIDEAQRIYNETKNNKDNIYLVGLVNNEVVAHMKITIIRTIYDSMNNYAILNHVCVKEEYRRCGIATKMLDYGTNICLNRGCSSLKLWSNNYREAAHACYKEYGFIVEDAKFFKKDIVEVNNENK